MPKMSKGLGPGLWGWGASGVGSGSKGGGERGATRMPLAPHRTAPRPCPCNLLLERRALGLGLRREGLVAGDLGHELVVVPRRVRFLGRLHLEQVHVVDHA